MRLNKSPLLFLLLLLGVILPAGALAHDARPLSVQITSADSNKYLVQWKVPPSVPDFNIPEVALAAPCHPLEEGKLNFQGQSVIKKRNFQCPGPLTGQSLTIKYPRLNPSLSTIIQAPGSSGENLTKLLKPDEKTWQIPAEPGKAQVAREYGLLGIEHIWAGWDHLLFLIGLIIIAGTSRRILITVTGFTVAHSLTLVLSTLNWVRLPLPPVEAVIALSIVFLATEIARGSKQSLTYRHPIIVSSAFGLLHGFGFASVLQEIGLPASELPISLLFFNLGVEVGQVIFILAILLGLKLILLSLPKSFHVWFQNPKTIGKFQKFLAYGLGGIASFWLVERVYSFWG